MTRSRSANRSTLTSLVAMPIWIHPTRQRGAVQLLLGQIFVDLADGDRAFTDGRRYPLG
jgi:hypothetical protein